MNIRNSAMAMVCPGILLLVGAEAQQVPKRQARVQQAPEQTRFAMRPWPKNELLLDVPAVQRELKLTSAQMDRLKRIEEELDRSSKERMEAVKELVEEEPDPEAKRALIMAEKSSAVIRAVDAEPLMLRVLDRRQRVRLDQIQLQASGLSGFLLEGMPERLNLAPEQVVTFQVMFKDAIDETQGIRKSGSELSGQVLAKMQRARKEGPGSTVASEVTKTLELEQEKADAAMSRFRKAIHVKIAKVLTKKQWQNYQKMLGKPFIVDGFLVHESSEKEPDRPGKPATEKDAKSR